MNNSQELAFLIKKTAKSKQIAVGKMFSDCGLSVNTLSSMQSGGYFPRLEAIAKIADYLDVSIDFLLGRKAQHPSDQYSTLFLESLAKVLANNDWDMSVPEVKADYEELHALIDRGGSLTLAEACEAAEKVGKSLSALLHEDTITDQQMVGMGGMLSWSVFNMLPEKERAEALDDIRMFVEFAINKYLNKVQRQKQESTLPWEEDT